MSNTSESFLVGVDFSHGKDVGVLIVGRKRMNETVEIINGFQGEEAWELYQKLITPTKGFESNGNTKRIF